MYISKMTVNNYRLLKETEINIEEDLSIIVGKNNCGKTSFLSLLNKCFGEMIGKFDYYDFNITFQNNLFKNVEINKEFKENEIKGIRADVYIEYNDDDNLANISKLLLDLDENNKTIILRYEYSLDCSVSLIKDEFEELYKQKEGKLTCTKKELLMKFMKKNYKRYFKFKKYSVLYDYKNKKINEDIKLYLDNKNGDLSKVIAFRYIDAKRGVSNVNSNELSVLACNYYKNKKNNKADSEIIDQLEDAANQTDLKFNGVYEEVFKAILDKITKFGGIKKNEAKLGIISQIQMLKLLQDNTTVVYKEDNKMLPENYNGLGYLNLFSIIMNVENKLCELKCVDKNETPADINVLFIEEPEAHTHPQMQYVFIKNIKNMLKESSIINGDVRINLQTIMTTHSSKIVSESEFNDIKYFIKENKNDGQVISKNLKNLEIEYQKEGENSYKFLKQYLTLNRSEIFFADKVILIEGDTERILLPAMMKKIDQENKENILPMLSQNISIIEVGNYSKIYSKFIEFIGIKTLIITDIDTVKSDRKCCEVEEGVDTSNASIKFYLKDINEEESIVEKLKSLNLEDKILTYDKKAEKWVNNSEGNVLLVYQTEENGYNARSFEDAFININKSMFTNLVSGNKDVKIKELKNRYPSLKNHGYFLDNKYTPYNLANECVNKKSSFAMDILLNSQDKVGKEFANWEIPTYIKEGLEWLQKD